ncbi:MAG: hypothetical protein IJY20_07215 [Clostridia bacterium]|nr:hypothetical protein [Clostridia bacterium]
MPYMHVRTNVKVNEEKRLSLKKAFGEAISLLPGKSESWLMVDIEDEACLFFAGESDRPLAMVEAELLGKSTPAAYEKLTARVCEIMQQELAVSPDGVYVKYAEVDHWGYNGSNF